MTFKTFDIVPHEPIPILIAENNPSLLEALPAVLYDRMPELRLDVCTSRDQGTKYLTKFQYHTVISSVHLAGSDDRFLARHTAVQSGVPLIITAGTSEEELARRALQQGAFDLITHPLDPVQTVTTVRVALWHHKLPRLINHKESVIAKHRKHMEKYPKDKRTEALFQQTLAAIDQGLACLKASIPTIIETRARALERLSARQRGSTAIAQPVTTLLMITDSSHDLEIWPTELRESFPHSLILKATNVRDGLEVYRNHKIDCLLLDLDLSDSYEALLEVIPDRQHPKIAVIGLTHLQNPNLHEVALYHGVHACLVKQHSSARDLTEAIKNAVISVCSYH